MNRLSRIIGKPVELFLSSATAHSAARLKFAVFYLQRRLNGKPMRRQRCDWTKVYRINILCKRAVWALLLGLFVPVCCYFDHSIVILFDRITYLDENYSGIPHCHDDSLYTSLVKNRA